GWTPARPPPPSTLQTTSLWVAVPCTAAWRETRRPEVTWPGPVTVTPETEPPPPPPGFEDEEQANPSNSHTVQRGRIEPPREASRLRVRFQGGKAARGARQACRVPSDAWLGRARGPPAGSQTPRYAEYGNAFEEYRRFFATGLGGVFSDNSDTAKAVRDLE